MLYVVIWLYVVIVRLVKNIVRLTRESWGFIYYACHLRGGSKGFFFFENVLKKKGRMVTILFTWSCLWNVHILQDRLLNFFTCSAPYIHLLLYSNFYDPVKEHLSCKMSFTAICWLSRILHVHVNSSVFPVWVVVVVGGIVIFVIWSRGGCKKKNCMMWADMKKNAPFKISSALPYFSKHNKCSLVLAIKQTVSQLRERINADQEWRSWYWLQIAMCHSFLFCRIPNW